MKKPCSTPLGDTLWFSNEEPMRDTNSFNKEWIKTWDGIIYLQVCLDYYAVITYITNYVCKSETSLLQSLVETITRCKSESSKENMRKVEDTFLSHRQMSESEAYYCLFPALHLKDSNIKSVFLPTEFPENRSHYLKKVRPEERHLYAEESLVNIDGKDGE